MGAVSRADVTGGSIPRVLLVLAAPLIVQNVVQVVQQLVDTFWLGRLGEEAVAAVGMNFPILAVLVAVTSIAPFVGTQVLVSQHYGADRTDEARGATAHGMVLALLVAGVGGLAVFLAASQIVSLLGAGPEVTRLAAIYLAIYALGLPIAATSDALEAGFVGWGATRAALYINVTTVAVNVVLDPFLIFGWWFFPAMGIQGAALATVAGFAAGLALALVLALGRFSVRPVAWPARGFRREPFAELLDVGLPSAGQNLAQQSVRVLIVGVVATVGGAAGLAAYTVGARVASVAFIPASGLAQAAQTMVGQNLGADRPGRAARTTWIGVALAVVGLSAVAAVQWLVPELLARLFVPDISAEALALTVEYLVVLAYGYWAIGATYLVLAGFNGARRTRTSMVVSLLQYWAVRLPIAVVGALFLGYGVSAVFWAVTISNVAAAIGAAAYYRHVTGQGMLERAAAEARAVAD